MAVSARDPQQPLPAQEPGLRRRHARGKAPRRASGGAARWLRELAIVIVTALVLSALVRAFLAQAFYVPSASMEDTLQVNDRILASKITTSLGGVTRGEVVVFKDPGGWLPDPEPSPEGFPGMVRTAFTFVGLLPSDSGQDLVKRVIGIEGDRVACCDDSGRILLNGVALDEDYIIGPTDQVRFDVVVPKGAVFVMGDNRGNSRDSRFHLDVADGGVPEPNVVGRVFLVVWPLSQVGTMPIPAVYGNPAIADGPGGVEPSAQYSPEPSTEPTADGEGD
ncbi:MAG: signal peptidase I [Actinomycetota bacterium]|nr:signal peptidase I [Actinomycetota bacterium]